MDKQAKLITTRTSKAIYKDGDKVVKVFDENYSKADVLNEALNQARVEETGLPLPKLLGVEMIDGKWSIVSEFIEGETLKDLMKKNPEKMDEYLNLFVDLQIKIHKATSPLLTKLKDKMKRKIAATSFDATTRYELQTRLEGMHDHTKVCHGDFRPSNVIVKPNGEAYIIDWAHATQGNASADAARTFLVLSLHEEPALADKYLDLFSKKADIPKQLVQRWLPIVAATQTLKNREEEKELLAKWVDVADYE